MDATNLQIEIRAASCLLSARHGDREELNLRNEWSSSAGRWRSPGPVRADVRAHSSPVEADIALFVVSPLKRFAAEAWKMDERQPPTFPLPRCWQPGGIDVNVPLRSIFFLLTPSTPHLHLMYCFMSKDHFAVMLTQMWGNNTRVLAAQLTGCKLVDVVKRNRSHAVCIARRFAKCRSDTAGLSSELLFSSTFIFLHQRPTVLCTSKSKMMLKC